MSELASPGKVYFPNAIFEVPDLCAAQTKALACLNYFKTPSIEVFLELSKQATPYHVPGPRGENLLEPYYVQLSQGRGLLHEAIKKHASLVEQCETVAVSLARLSEGRLEHISKSARDYISFVNMIEKTKEYEFGFSLYVEQGQLPSKRILDSHLSDTVTFSKSFRVTPLGLDYAQNQDMRQVVDLVYLILKSPFAYRLLPDISQNQGKGIVESHIMPQAIGEIVTHINSTIALSPRGRGRKITRH